MRITAAVLTLLWAVASVPQTLALSVCPISDFTITFEADSAELDALDWETIDAGANRARMCDLDAVELVIAGDLHSEGSLAARRLSAVRDALVHNGLNPDIVHAVNISRETYGVRTSPTPDAVTVLIFFDHGRPD